MSKIKKQRKEEIKKALCRVFDAMREARIDIGGCGCCGSPFVLSEVKGENHVYENVYTPDINEADKYIEEIAEYLVNGPKPKDPIEIDRRTQHDKAMDELEKLLNPDGSKYQVQTYGKTLKVSKDMVYIPGEDEDA